MRRKVRPNIFTWNNPPSGPADEHAARELELYIDSDRGLYFQQFIPIVKNLMLKRRKGIYDREKAVKLFMYLMESGAKKYIKEFGTAGAPIDTVFNKNTRLVAARAFRDSFETEAELGNYDRMIGPVSNPVPFVLGLAGQAAVASVPWHKKSKVRKNIYVWNNPRGDTQVEAAARAVGLLVATWAPGDGSTRYRFFKATPGARYADYHQGDGIYTALGRKDSMSFIVAYQLGRKTRRNPSRAAQAFISGEIRHLRHKGYPEKRAQAAAYSIARRKGFRVNACTNPACNNPRHHHKNPSSVVRTFPVPRGLEAKVASMLRSAFIFAQARPGAVMTMARPEIVKRAIDYVKSGKPLSNPLLQTIMMANPPVRELQCDMKRDCKQPVTHIDDKGFVYCHEHGVQRKGWRPCRQLTSKELKQLKSGIPLAHYNPPLSIQWDQMSDRHRVLFLEMIGYPYAVAAQYAKYPWVTLSSAAKRALERQWLDTGAVMRAGTTTRRMRLAGRVGAANPLTRKESALALRQAKMDLTMAKEYKRVGWPGHRAMYAGSAYGRARTVAQFGPHKPMNAAHKVEDRARRSSGVSRAIANPGVRLPRPGTKMTIAQALDLAERLGNQELVRQCHAAMRLQKASDRGTRCVVWKELPIGSPTHLDGVVAMTHYGKSPEDMYRPPTGSKKGSHMYRHSWKRPVEVLASPSGKAIIKVMGPGQKVGDWMRG